jgi:methyltransferase family protein
MPDTVSQQNTALMQLVRVLKDLGYRFTAITPASHDRVNGRPGNEWAFNLEGIFGWSRPFQASAIPKEAFELMRVAEVVAPHENGWRSLIRVSTLNNLFFLHSAYPTLEANAVFFGPDTYRFVSAIEHHLAMSSASVHRAVDIGCGAGPGAITLASHFPQAEVLAGDINVSALHLTAINAHLAGARVRPCYSDLLHNIKGMFDFIVANPPYLIDPAQRTYRHGGGQLGSGMSLDIIDAALPRLSPGGTLLLYTGTVIVNGIDRFCLAVEQKLCNVDAQWRYAEIDPDVFGEELSSEIYRDADRIAALTLTVTAH